jgi:malonyl-CoA O-methyltransferase
MNPSSSPAGYDRWAAVYDRDGNPLQAGGADRARRDWRHAVWMRLDLGCGTGRHALWLAENGAKSRQSTSLRACWLKPVVSRTRIRSGFVVHDLHQPLPFEDNAFDVIVSGLVLEHLHDLNGPFREARRVLKSGGRAVVSSMHSAMFLRGAQARFTDPESGELVQPGSVPHSIADFVMAAIRAGFHIDHISEHAPDEQFAISCPRAAKYVRWPMLVVMQLQIRP